MKVIKVCKTCSKDFVSYDVGKRALSVCCSVACAAEQRKIERAQRENRICPICSVGFKILKCISKTYCSKKCQHKSLVKLDHLSSDQQLDLLRSKYEKLVIKQDGCWQWNGATQKGYGALLFMRKNIRAHRASWILHNGQIPDSMHVLHKCDNPPCSNPEHLFLGSHKDNMKDMRSKGLHRQYSKLTLDQVKQIKISLCAGEKVEDIRKRYGVGFSTINDIKDGRTWKSL